MRIFLTGGTGFIGKFAVRRLSPQHSLLLLVRDPSRTVALFPTSRKIHFVKGGLGDMPRWRAAVKRFKPEICVHLAWEGLSSLDYGVEMSLKNLRYGADLFQFLFSIGCKKIVAAGTCWEYGVSSGRVHEEMALHPLNPFAAAKVGLSLLGEQMAKTRGAAFTWLRLFYVYGPGQRSTSLIPSLIRQKRNGLSPTLKNPDGGNDFIYVDDVARAIAAAVSRKNASGSYNVGSGKLQAVRSVADLIWGKKLKNVKKGKGFYADILKIKKEIGWKPAISLQEGIQKTANYYRAHELS